MTRARVLCVTIVVMLALHASALAATPSPEQVLNRYLQAIQSHAYSRAYGMLNAQSRRYYQTESNFSSVFQAPDVELLRYRILRISGKRRMSVLVQEEARRSEFGRGRVAVSLRRSYTVVRENNTYAIVDVGHPYKIIKPEIGATSNGVRVILHAVEFYPDVIAMTLTMQNLQSGFAMLFPYNKTVLTDDRDRVYHALITKDWRLTDRQLFLGLRLAGNEEYTGVMRFVIPVHAIAREFHLEISPVVRDRAALPFSVRLPAVQAVPA